MYTPSLEDEQEGRTLVFIGKIEGTRQIQLGCTFRRPDMAGND